MSDQPDQRAVPYVSYVTVKNFIEGLRGHPLPTKINKSLMSNLAYSVQPQLLAALRYLDLVTADGTPTTKMTQLVEAEDKQRSTVMTKIIKDAYPFLFTDGFDLKRTSPGELDEKFKTDGGVGGSTVGKAVSFFIAAANDVGFALSPHLAKRKTTTPSTGPRRKRTKRANGHEQTQHEQPPAPPALTSPQDVTQQLLSKFPNFDPSWDDKLKAAWFAGYGDLMKLTSGKQTRKTKDT